MVRPDNTFLSLILILHNCGKAHLYCPHVLQPSRSCYTTSRFQDWTETKKSQNIVNPGWRRLRLGSSVLCTAQHQFDQVLHSKYDTVLPLILRRLFKLLIRLANSLFGNNTTFISIHSCADGRTWNAFSDSVTYIYDI